MTPSPGPLLAPLDSGFGYVRDQINSYGRDVGQFDQQTSSALSEQLSGNPSTSIDKQFTDNYLNSVARNNYSNYQQYVSPQLSLAGGPGSLLSSRIGKVKGQVMQGIQNDLNALGTNAYRQDALLGVQLKESALDRQRQAIPLAEAFANRGIRRGASVASLLQGTFQGRADQENAARLAEYYRTRPENNPAMANAQNYTTLGYLNPVVKSSSPFPWASAIGLVAGIVAAPFTGGASLALAAASGAQIAGNMGSNGKADIFSGGGQQMSSGMQTSSNAGYENQLSGGKASIFGP